MVAPVSASKALMTARAFTIAPRLPVPPLMPA